MRDWHADLASTAFVKIIAVYGQIDENGHAVRKWPARKMAITDKMVKNLRTNHREMAVKCVLLTDKSSKTGAFLQSDRCRTCRGFCPRGVFPGFCLLSGVRDNARLRAKCRFLKSARKIRSKAAFINEEAHDNNALPEFFNPILLRFRCT